MTDDPLGKRRPWRTNEEWARLSERISAADARLPNEPPRWGGWQRLAAAGVVIAAGIGIGAAVAGRMHARPAETTVVKTAAGERRVIRLSDSTVITLGPETSIRIASSPTRRDVALDGMADFDVTHDAARPFVVTARNTRTVDVGTEFVVRAYAGDSSTYVAVTSGQVSVTNLAAPSSSRELRAGDVAVVADSASAVALAPARASALTSWLGGGIAFDDAPLSAVVAELARWFDADIRIDDPALAKRRVTAVYNDARLDGVLDALAATLNVHYSRSGRTVVLRPGAR